jgi:hypothetical protein
MQRAATIRVDPEPGGKKFQGIWLELEDGRRWVIAYRPHALWRSFQDRKVTVTGTCYRPHGQAIDATHYKIDDLQLIDQDIGAFETVGPERELRGKFYQELGNPRLTESSPVRFIDEAGTLYWIAGSDARLREPGAAVLVTARHVHRAPSYADAPGGPTLWLFAIHDPDHVEDPETAPRTVPCP